MKTFNYTVIDELGLHARPAGLLCKQCAAFGCNIKIACNGKEADAKRLFGVMGLNVKKADTITLTFDGADEANAESTIKEFCSKTF